MRNSKTKLVLESLVVAGLLAACGGGGGGGGDASSSASGANNQTVVTSFTEGSYIGTSNSTYNPSFNLLILENGQYWEIYGTQTTAGFSIAGMLQGTINASNGSFSSSDTKDFGFTPAISATIAGTYNTTAKTITGKFIIPGLNIDFSAGPDTATLYNYATPAKLSTLTGVWTLTDTSGQNLTVNIADSGAFTGTYATGCTVSGTVAPRASGKNVFNTTMQFGPAPCSLPNQTASGIALVYPLASGQTQALFAQVDSTRSYGSVAFGLR